MKQAIVKTGIIGAAIAGVYLSGLIQSLFSLDISYQMMLVGVTGLVIWCLIHNRVADWFVQTNIARHKSQKKVSLHKLPEITDRVSRIKALLNESEPKAVQVLEVSGDTVTVEKTTNQVKVTQWVNTGNQMSLRGEPC